jgi:hypothetical protein
LRLLRDISGRHTILLYFALLVLCRCSRSDFVTGVGFSYYYYSAIYVIVFELALSAVLWITHDARIIFVIQLV